jgi:hypothetical protein
MKSGRDRTARGSLARYRIVSSFVPAREPREHIAIIPLCVMMKTRRLRVRHAPANGVDAL